MKNLNVTTAVVLAGGAGLRLKPLTNNCPKPMVKLLGKPILHWVIEWLKNNGISDVIIGVAYRKEAVMNYFKDGSQFGVNIKYSVHSVDGETGEGFRLAITRYVKDDLLVGINGDELTDFNLVDLINFHKANNPIATIAVAHPRCPFGVINVQEDGAVSSFEEKPILASVLVSTGLYVFDKRILNYLPEQGSMESITFPLLANKKLLRAFPINGTWLTVNTMKDLKIAETTLKQNMETGKWPKYL